MKNLFKKILTPIILMFSLVGCFSGDSDNPEKITEDAKAYFYLVTLQETPDNIKFKLLKEVTDKNAKEALEIQREELGMSEEVGLKFYEAMKGAYDKLEPTVEIADIEGSKNKKLVTYTFLPIDILTSQEKAIEEMQAKSNELGEDITEEESAELLEETRIAIFRDAELAQETVTVTVEFKKANIGWEPLDLIALEVAIVEKMFYAGE